jgi:hypothetical protein
MQLVKLGGVVNLGAFQRAKQLLPSSRQEPYGGRDEPLVEIFQARRKPLIFQSPLDIQVWRSLA